MRCKNCGAENDDSRHICEICGSPLYDENDEIKMPGENEQDDADLIDYNNYKEERKKKRNIIIGIACAVAAVAIIIIAIFAAGGSSDEKDTTTLPPSSEISTSEATTKKPVTTEKTTEATTAPTTAPTTTPSTAAPTAAVFKIAVDIDGNGTVTGDGAYESGKKAVLTATPDEGYQFAGWFDNSTGKLVASGSKYTINVKSNLNLTAKFERLESTTAHHEEAAQ